MSYFGFNTITIPSTVPASLEVQTTEIVAQSVNPFTHATQQYDWGVKYKDISVALPPMTASNAAYWLTFFDQLNGTSKVFCFSGSVCAQFPYELTLVTGHVTSASGTSVVLSSNAYTSDSYWDGQTLLIDAGTGAGQSNTISTWVNSTLTATVSSSWTTEPDSSSVYSIPRYFRLKNPSAKWSIKLASIYYFTFECTEVVV